MSKAIPDFDPKLDLMLERVIEVPRRLVWAAWTKPEHIRKWFTPAPWKTVDCTVDLRPGGLFTTVMQSPEGQNFPNEGCYLEVVPEERLVWTDALVGGYRPRVRPAETACPPFAFTAKLLLEDRGTSTKYTAIALHPDEQCRIAHEKMGFYEGWGAALDQLVALMKPPR